MKTNKILSIMSTAAIIVFLVIATVLSLSSCGDNTTGGSGLSEIFMTRNNYPRQTYVEGQDLDLSSGTLTVVIDGENKSVSLSNENVTVTGYNRDVIGVQELTVSYGGKTTTFSINVIPRLSPESYETDYFVGDDFNKEKGRLRVALDNGTTTLVAMNSDSVSLKSFNSAIAGKSTITLEYNSGSNTYECSFEVNVHTPAEVTFTPPKKTDYGSHEASLDLKGGYFYVKAAAPSTLTKMVLLTDSMITGYDPESVTAANREEPQVQTILVNYAGYSGFFEVTVRYSGVKVVMDQAKKLTNIDYNRDINEIVLSKTQGAAAFDAICEYYGLKESEKLLIDDATVLTVVKAATIYLRTLYSSACEDLEDAFIIDFVNNQYMITGTSPAAVKDAVAILNDYNSTFNKAAELIREIKNDFGTQPINDTLTINHCILAHGEDFADTILDRLEHIINVWNAMSDIPSNWAANVQSLEAYKDKINTTVSIITLSQYHGSSANNVYKVISGWRADFFDIIYAYYFYVLDGGQELIGTRLWEIVPAPSLINEWYLSYLYSSDILNQIAQNQNSAQILGADLWEFYFYYLNTVLVEQEILVGGINRDLYIALGCHDWSEAIRLGGYIPLMGNAFGDVSVERVWGAYTDLLICYYNCYGDVNMMVQTYAQYFDNFMAQFVKLTPVQLNNFLSSLSFRYNDINTMGAEFSIIDYRGGQIPNLVTFFIANYYALSLPEECTPLIQDLFAAAEQASLIGINPNASAKFQEIMGSFTQKYFVFSGVAKSQFDSIFMEMTNRYITLYNAISSPLSLTEEEQAQLEEIVKLLNYLDGALAIAGDSTATASRINDSITLVFALYERIEELYYDILNGSNTKLAYALSSTVFTLTVGEESYNYTLDTRINSARVVTRNLMLSNYSGSYLLWDVYQASGIKGLFARMLPLMLAEYRDQAYEGDVSEFIDVYNKLSDVQKYYFVILGNRLYSAAVMRYYNSLLTEDNLAKELVAPLISAEISYAVYKVTQDETVLADFISYMEDLVNKVEGITGEENAKNFNAVLSELYNTYLSEYERLKPVEEPV